MSAANRLLNRARALTDEATARKGAISEDERAMFRRRAQQIREDGVALREEIDARVDALECERDDLDDAHNVLEELELELVLAEEAEAE